jgi:hypothetical protein
VNFEPAVRTPTGDSTVMEDEIANRLPMSSLQVDRHRIRICFRHPVPFEEALYRVIGQPPDWAFLLDHDEVLDVQPPDIEAIDDLHKRNANELK